MFKNLNYDLIVKKVRATDEEKVYANLAQLNHDAAFITRFKSIYKGLYNKDVETHIQTEFSNL